MNRFAPNLALRTSMLPFVEQDVPLDNSSHCRLANIPLFAISAVENYLAKSNLAN